jgi:hypothetical protein
MQPAIKATTYRGDRMAKSADSPMRWREERRAAHDEHQDEEQGSSPSWSRLTVKIAGAF